LLKGDTRSAASLRRQLQVRLSSRTRSSPLRDGALPDGDGLFHFVDEELAGRESLAAMRGDNLDPEGRFIHFDNADAMDEANGFHGPPLCNFVCCMTRWKKSSVSRSSTSRSSEKEHLQTLRNDPARHLHLIFCLLNHGVETRSRGADANAPRDCACPSTDRR